MNELEYFKYSGRRKDEEIWRCCRRSIVNGRLDSVKVVGIL